ncbi:MAG: pyridoxamine 5'-phosphate oxidase family protein [Anaerocolumna sp.]
MINYVEKLQENPCGVFATQENGRVKTRVFQYLFAEGNKVYFCTSNEKDVFKQIKENNYVSFCVNTKDYSEVLSINGKAIFVDDVELKDKILEMYPNIKGIYKSGGNPVFEAFYVDVEEVETFTFTEGAKKVKI